MARQTVAGSASSSRLTAGLRRLEDPLGLRTQLIAITAVLSGLVAIGLVVVVQIALAGAAKSSTQNVLDDRVTALVMGIKAASEGGTITVPRAQLDPGVAVYDAAGHQVAGSVP